jgi:glycosyltransferase involved in cell wall biosynthesis
MAELTASGRNVCVSIIVPTRNRADVLEDLLHSLEKQTLAPALFEVVVVDNCSSDPTVQLIERWKQRGLITLRYFRNDENRGQIHSRNRGAREARGGILAFTDSDCRVSPEWLSAIKDALDGNPDVGFVAGPVRDKPEQPVGFFSLPTFSNEGENLTYPACNIAYRRPVFEEMEGFDEAHWPGDLGDKSYGDSDTDLAWRAKRAGHRPLFVSEMVVYHQVWQVSFWKWLSMQTLAIRVPSVFRQTPELRPHLMWRDPILYPENALFYAAIAGVIGSIWSAWLLLLAVPHVFICMYRTDQPLSARRLLRAVPRLVLLTLQRAILCASLVAGSLKFRTLVI